MFSRFLLLLSALLVPAFAQEGPLDPSPPAGITPEQIIQRFAAKEKEFKLARENYIYRQSVKVQGLDGNTVTGEYQIIFDVTYDEKRNRKENVLFAPQSTLERSGLSMSKEDHEDIRNLLPFVLTSDELPQYNVNYVGKQQVDELGTYVFEVAPKLIEKGKRYFQGRIWVDDRDFQIVKTYGKPVPETRASQKKKKNEQENLFPNFTTYREQIDGKYWFPTYSRADEVLHFATGDQHIRIIVKYTDYKTFETGFQEKVTYQGEAVKSKPAEDASKSPAQSKPQ
ncbi:MAG TPA: hypothetical protein VNK82_14455 [Terriglobales bacterium]|nr:hypothetical protein [Terriglobales bacterium]